MRKWLLKLDKGDSGGKKFTCVVTDNKNRRITPGKGLPAVDIATSS